MAGTPRHWDWPRLADHVIARRVALGMGRRDLAAATGVTERSIGKMERGESVSRDTVTKTEIALRWEQGSGRRVLEGGSPSEADRADHAGDRSYQAILDSPGLTDGEKVAAIEAIEARRAKIARGGFTEQQHDAFGRAPAAYKALVDRKRGKNGGEVTGESAIGA
jgi:transcriptional regulator with XRE-family HTH domain